MDLIGFKKEIAPLEAIAAGFYDVWGEPVLLSLSVLVQNMTFDSSRCWGYSKEGELAKIERIITLMRRIGAYEEHHAVQYIVRQVDMAWVACCYASDQENDPFGHAG
jgi:hypothetical protein